MTKTYEILNKNILKLQTPINEEAHELITFNSLKNMLIEEIHNQKGKNYLEFFINLTFSPRSFLAKAGRWIGYPLDICG